MNPRPGRGRRDQVRQSAGWTGRCASQDTFISRPEGQPLRGDPSRQRARRATPWDCPTPVDSTGGWSGRVSRVGECLVSIGVRPESASRAAPVPTTRYRLACFGPCFNAKLPSSPRPVSASPRRLVATQERSTDRRAEDGQTGPNPLTPTSGRTVIATRRWRQGSAGVTACSELPPPLGAGLVGVDDGPARGRQIEHEPARELPVRLHVPLREPLLVRQAALRVERPHVPSSAARCDRRA